MIISCCLNGRGSKEEEEEWMKERQEVGGKDQTERKKRDNEKQKKKVKEKREFCVRLIFHLRALQCFFFFVFLLKPQLQILFVRRNWKKFISNKVKIVLNPFRFPLTKLNYFFILSDPTPKRIKDETQNLENNLFQKLTILNALVNLVK